MKSYLGLALVVLALALAAAWAGFLLYAPLPLLASTAMFAGAVLSLIVGLSIR